LSSRWICRNCQTPYNAIDSPPDVEGKCDKCGGELYQRADDKPETVKNRLKVYFAETSPLIDHYTGEGKLLEIDGEGDIAEVNRRIINAIKGNQ
jgi:adenylate kinase